MSERKIHNRFIQESDGNSVATDVFLFLRTCGHIHIYTYTNRKREIEIFPTFPEKASNKHETKKLWHVFFNGTQKNFVHIHMHGCVHFYCSVSAIFSIIFYIMTF